MQPQVYSSGVQTTATPLALRGFLSRPGLCWKFNYRIGANLRQVEAPSSVVTSGDAKRWATTEADRPLTFAIDSVGPHGATFVAVG